MHKDSFQDHLLSATLAAANSTCFLQSRILLTPVEAGAACGWAKQTVYNKLSQDDFPIPLVEFGGRKMVRTSDLMEFIAKLHVLSVEATRTPCKIGRPTKTESIRRREKQSGVRK